MVPQNRLRTCQGKQVIVENLNKCLNTGKIADFVPHTCAPISELPCNIGSMVLGGFKFAQPNRDSYNAMYCMSKK